jgi:hypothetical protein
MFVVLSFVKRAKSRSVVAGVARFSWASAARNGSSDMRP